MRTTLVPLETPLRRVVALGPDVFVSPDAGGLARVDLASGRLTPLAAPMKDRWGTPSVFSGLARRGSGLLLASIDDAWLAHVEGDALVEERGLMHKGEASAVAIGAACDDAGDVSVVAAYNMLVRVMPGLKRPKVKAGDDRFWAVAVSADGLRVANGRESGAVELRDPIDLAVVRTLEGLHTTPLALAFSPDGRWLVGSDDSTRSRIWDLTTGAVRDVEGLAKVVKLLWTPDSACFWAVSLTRHVALFDVTDTSTPTAEVFPEGLDTRYLCDGALLPDGRVVCVVEDRGLLVLDPDGA